jgi:hypothetical protein
MACRRAGLDGFIGRYNLIINFLRAFWNNLWGLENQFKGHLSRSSIHSFTGMVWPQGDPFVTEGAALLLTKLFRKSSVKFKTEFIHTG